MFCVILIPRSRSNDVFLNASPPKPFDIVPVTVNFVVAWVTLCRSSYDLDPRLKVKYYTIIDFNEIDIRIYLPEKVIIYITFKGR